jgi:predicted esterase
MIRLFAAALLLALVHGTAVAQTLRARPQASAAGLPAGETELANGATVYRPRSAGPGPLPLVVLLHGAGGYPPGFLQRLEPEADRRGLILFQPHSAGRTWDVIQNLGSKQLPWRGPDLRRNDEALADLFRRASVDRSRIVLLGFSDGASYALSLGLANPGLFTAVVALSPGMFAPPSVLDRNQRIFIAHGRDDQILPFDNAREIAGALSGNGAKLRFRPFNGRHEIDRGVLREALDYALGLQASGPAPTSSSN